MKLHCTALLTVCLFTFGTLSARAEVYDLTTTAGKTYQQCRVLKIELDGVSFRHSKGIAKVLFRDLTAEWRKHFGYDAEKAKAHEVKQKEEKAKVREEAAKKAFEMAKAQQEAAAVAMENQALQALFAAAQRNGGGYGFNGFIGMTGSAPTQFFPQHQVVDGRRYYCQRPVRGSADLAVGCGLRGALIQSATRVWTPRGFNTGCNVNGFTPVPFFAVPGIGPNVAPMVAQPCVIRGGGMVMGH